MQIKRNYTKNKITHVCEHVECVLSPIQTNQQQKKASAGLTEANEECTDCLGALG